MKTLLRTRLIALSLVITLSAGVAGAQRGTRPSGSAERAAEAVGRMQDRAGRAQERATGAQDRANRASEASDRAGMAIGRGQIDVAPLRGARALANAQYERLKELVSSHPKALEMVDRSAAVRSEVIALDASVEVLRLVRTAGYSVAAEVVIDGLDLRTVTLRTPNGLSVERALEQLRRIAPDAEFAANHLHIQSGGTAIPVLSSTASLAQSPQVASPPIGIVDGGVAKHLAIRGPVEQRAFVQGGAVPNAHATAVASLAVGSGPVRGAAPGAPLLVADVYGRSPSGGNAVAVARALGWMAERRVPVVVMSLVGPSNPLVARAVARAQSRGVHVVAPVGNSGPAAPPAFPASYPKVIAVTGVDGRNRALIEAGRSLHLDYAAPGADIVAAGTSGGVAPVRGTSFAAPLVAGRLWRAARTAQSPLPVLDREAVDLGKRGADKVFGRGLICGDCRITRKRTATGIK